MADSLIIHIDGDDSGYRKALENIEKTTKSAMSAMGDSTEKATDAIDDLGEKAEETAEDIKKDFKETEKQSKTSSSKIENNFSKGFDKIEQASEKAKEKVKKIVGKMGAAIVGGLGIGTVSLTALAETTREYREDLNRLDAAFKTSGKSVESARKSYSDFYAVLGEEDRSVEAVNHLAQLCNSQEELAYWSDICAGVSATFGDSLPIEGLTEAANETAKVGKVTGPLADALNWVGIMEDDFNNKLAACNSEQERSAMITKTLNKAYEKQAGTFKSLNANVMNSRKANQKFSDALAEIGEASEPIMTGLREIGAEILKDLTPCLKDVTGYINRNMPSIKAAVMNTLDGAKNLVMFLIDNKDGTVTAITMIGSAFLAWKTVKIVGDTTQSLKNMSFALKTMQGTIEGVSGSSTTLLSVLGGVGSKAALPIATAAAVATAVAAYYKGTAMTTEYIEGLRNVESEIKNICDSYGDNVKAVEDNIKAESGNISTLQILKEELNKIVDANGNVTHGYETRAEYILGELSAATGVEGKLIDGQIKNWNEYSAAVDNAVISLQKELMMESESSKIRTAYESITSLRGEEAKALNEKAAAQREYNQAQAEYLEQIAAEGYASSSVTEKRELAKEALEQAKDAYDEISSQIGQFNSDIKTSEQKIEALANGTPEQI